MNLRPMTIDDYDRVWDLWMSWRNMGFNDLDDSRAGIDRLLEAIEANLPVRMKRVRLMVPFSEAGCISDIRSSGTLLHEEYTAEGIAVEAVVDEILYARVRKYAAEE